MAKDDSVWSSKPTAAGRSVRKDILVIGHSGPFDEPDQVGKALARMPGIQGFFGASSIKQLPTERGIRGQVQEFKGLAFAKSRRRDNES